MIAEYGLELPAFYIENVSLPPEVEKVLDKRTSTSSRRRPLEIHRLQRRRGDGAMAPNPGGGGGMAAGMGRMGMAMADRMARRGPWGAAPAADPRNPAAAARRRALARGEGRQGHRPLFPRRARPHGRRGLDHPDSWLWTPGGPDWQRGRDVTELADLFSAPPPPPPAG